MRPMDTSAEARERQVAAYRAMTPDDRLRLADEMSTEVRELARAGIRARAGRKLSDDEVDAELARILLGPELADSVAGHSRAGSR